MKLIIKAYPKFINIVSHLPKSADVKSLSRALVGNRSVAGSSLYISGNGYYLCVLAGTRQAAALIGNICEHSERVFIGKEYYIAVREHMTPVIDAYAVQKLS